jgi:hypothetical protein
LLLLGGRRLLLLTLLALLLPLLALLRASAGARLRVGLRIGLCDNERLLDGAGRC